MQRKVWSACQPIELFVGNTRKFLYLNPFLMNLPNFTRSSFDLHMLKPMPKFYCFLAFVLFLLHVSSPKLSACGYSYIGECSTGIHLRINNTLDSFNIADCSFGKNFNGLDLGEIQTLNLARATAITWESCDNNVASVGLYYRVYEIGQPAGNWSIFNLMEVANELVGPYTERYHSKFANTNLAAGLTTGKNYILEVYFLAQIDTIGNDFIPETTMVQNNNGQNYQLQFTFGGPSAPPFSVVATRIIDEKCPGDSTGSVGVTVYGNQNNLFYQWSNVNNNFHTLYELSAGAYSVTVSGVNGYTQTQTMTVGQSDPIDIAFQNIQQVICGNTPGSATAVVQGGVRPYAYLWETGEPDSTATIPIPGAWGLSVTDANGCTAAASVQVGGSTTLEQSLNKIICEGSSYTLDGHVFNTAGVFDVLVGGNGNCDTLFHLTISTLNPAAALTNLPGSADLTCTNPTLTLCANNLPATTFIWQRVNVTVSTTACLTINSSAPYTVYATTLQSGQSCTASRIILINSHLVAPLVQVSGVATYNNCTTTAAMIELTATTNANPVTFLWSLNGNTISTVNTCTLEVANPLNFTPPTILVTDAYGCVGTSGSTNIVINQPPNAPLAESATTPASGSAVADGSIQLSISGGQPPYAVFWENGSSGINLSGLLPGNYCYTISDLNGCMSTGCEDVEFTNGTEEWADAPIQVYPNPLPAGNKLFIVMPDVALHQSGTLTLYNLLGQIVWQENLPETGTNKQTCTPGALAPGQYVVRINSGRFERVQLLTVL